METTGLHYLKVVCFVVQDEISCNEPLSRIKHIFQTTKYSTLSNNESWNSLPELSSRGIWTTKKDMQCIEEAETVRHKGKGLVLNVWR